MAQPEVKPGCVLRQSSVNVLEKRKLVTDKEVSWAIMIDIFIELMAFFSELFGIGLAQ